MNAYEQAQDLYSRYPERSLILDILHYSQNHYCYFSPECIILAEIEEKCIWYIHLAVGVGALSRFVELAPFALPYVRFARPEKGHSEPKLYNWKRLTRLCKH